MSQENMGRAELAQPPVDDGHRRGYVDGPVQRELGARDELFAGVGLRSLGGGASPIDRDRHDASGYLALV
jgi:hypothetical protein